MGDSPLSVVGIFSIISPLALAERCERAAGPDKALDRAIAVAGFFAAPYTASLDAAMTLVPEKFGWWFSCGRVRPNGEPPEVNESFAMVWETVGDERFRAGDERHGKIANPALALCAAALRARAASVDTLPKGRDTK